jgi:hypothetical protein
MYASTAFEAVIGLSPAFTRRRNLNWQQMQGLGTTFPTG